MPSDCPLCDGEAGHPPPGLWPDCFACRATGDKYTELAPGDWRAVCDDCDEVLELDQGK